MFFLFCFGKVVYNVNTHVCDYLIVGETSDNPVDPLKTPIVPLQTLAAICDRSIIP